VKYLYKRLLYISAIYFTKRYIYIYIYVYIYMLTICTYKYNVEICSIDKVKKYRHYIVKIIELINNIYLINNDHINANFIIIICKVIFESDLIRKDKCK